MGVAAPSLDLGLGNDPDITLCIEIERCSHDDWLIDVRYKYKNSITAVRSIGRMNLTQLVATPDILREIGLHWLYNVRWQNLPIFLTRTLKEYGGP